MRRAWGRQEPEQLLGGGVLEGDDAAHQRGPRPTTAVAQDRVVLADKLPRELVHPWRGRDPGLAAQQVAAAVRHQRSSPARRYSARVPSTPSQQPPAVT